MERLPSLDEPDLATLERYRSEGTGDEGDVEDFYSPSSADLNTASSEAVEIENAVNLSLEDVKDKIRAPIQVQVSSHSLVSAGSASLSQSQSGDAEDDEDEEDEEEEQLDEEGYAPHILPPEEVKLAADHPLNANPPSAAAVNLNASWIPALFAARLRRKNQARKRKETALLKLVKQTTTEHTATAAAAAAAAAPVSTNKITKTTTAKPQKPSKPATTSPEDANWSRRANPSGTDKHKNIQKLRWAILSGEVDSWHKVDDAISRKTSKTANGRRMDNRTRSRPLLETYRGASAVNFNTLEEAKESKRRNAQLRHSNSGNSSSGGGGGSSLARSRGTRSEPSLNSLSSENTEQRNDATGTQALVHTIELMKQTNMSTSSSQVLVDDKQEHKVKHMEEQQEPQRIVEPEKQGQGQEQQQREKDHFDEEDDNNKNKSKNKSKNKNENEKPAQTKEDEDMAGGTNTKKHKSLIRRQASVSWTKEEVELVLPTMSASTKHLFDLEREDDHLVRKASLSRFKMSQKDRAKLQRILQKKWWILLPSSWLKVVVDAIVILCLMYTIIVTPMRVAFSDTPYDGADATIDALFFIDIGLNFFSAYETAAGELIVDPKRICSHYLRSWFVPDVLSTFPTNLLVSQAGWVTEPRMFRLFRLLKIFRLIQMFKGHRFTAFMTKVEYNPNVHPRIVRLMKLLAVVLVFGHVAACLWYFTGTFRGCSESDNLTCDTWVSAMDDFYPAGSYTPFSQTETVRRYLVSFYWTITTVSTTGYGDISSKSDEEMIYATVVMVTGVAFFSWVMASATSMIAASDQQNEENRKKMNSLLQFMKIYHVPRALQVDIVENVYESWNKTSEIHHWRELMSGASPYLVRKMAMWIHQDICEKSPFFRSLKGDPCVAHFMAEAKAETFLEGEYIARRGEPVLGWYIIDEGVVDAVSSSDGRVIYLRYAEGNTFGEVGLLRHEEMSRWKVCMKAQALTRVLMVNKRDLFKILGDFPAARVLLEATAEQRYLQLREAISKHSIEHHKRHKHHHHDHHRRHRPSFGYGYTPNSMTPVSSRAVSPCPSPSFQQQQHNHHSRHHRQSYGHSSDEEDTTTKNMFLLDPNRSTKRRPRPHSPMIQIQSPKNSSNNNNDDENDGNSNALLRQLLDEVSEIKHKMKHILPLDTSLDSSTHPSPSNSQQPRLFKFNTRDEFD